MQRFVHFLEQRGRHYIPDLDDTAYRQKATAFFPGFISAVVSVVWAAIFFLAGLPSLAWFFVLISASQFTSVSIATFRPQFTTGLGIMVGLVTILANLGIHIEAGGYSAGIWALAWLPIMPLAVFLTAGPRGGGLALVVSLAAAVIAALFDALFAESSLEIPRALLLGYNTFTLVVASLMAFFWSLYLFGELESARMRADELLLNILPAPIASRLKRKETTIADGYQEVTILFADIVDFTSMSAEADPIDVVNKLNDIFSDFDDLAARYGLEKIKTIGDAYMVAGGLPKPKEDHCQAVAAFAVDMLEAVNRHTSWSGDPIRLRVGINTGPVVAGVIGHQKFIYDLWGDAVNVASRMESNGLSNQIQVTAAVRECLESQYDFVARTPIYVKGKGEMVTYILQPESI